MRKIIKLQYNLKGYYNYLLNLNFGKIKPSLQNTGIKINVIVVPKHFFENQKFQT
jgi:hypothetical protein